MRVTYEIEGKTYTFRTFGIRDYAEVGGKIAMLPASGELTTVPSEDPMIRIAINESLLAKCSKVPKITKDEPEVLSDGVIPVRELSDSVFGYLFGRLSTDSGFSMEAADEIRPSSGTVEGS